MEPAAPPSPPTPALTKSRLLARLQCERRLWLAVHATGEEGASASRQLAFRQGNEVGALARQLAAAERGTGELIDIHGPGGWPEGLARCAARLAEPGLQVLFEAPFAAEGLAVICDIVIRHADGRCWLVEVKSATQMNGKPHVPDAAVQAWAMARAGLAPERVFIRLIDNTFTYRGNGDYRGLFKDIDVTQDVAEWLPRVPELLASSQRIAGGDEPPISPGPQCTTPYPCGFVPHCQAWHEARHGPAPEHPIAILDRRFMGRLQPEERERIAREGWVDLRQLPPGFPADDRAQRVVQATRSGAAWRSPQLAERLRGLPYPRHYLDFETIGLAVPRWAGTRPYQAVPFQWSCHVEHAAGPLEHREHLDVSGTDPRDAFARTLLQAVDGARGCVVVFNQSFEATRLKELAQRFPHHAQALDAVRARLVDLLPIVREHYYHPQQAGSYSLKQLLPAAVPGLGYDALVGVQAGTDAQLAWLEAADPATTPARQQAIAEQLRRYCQLDTRAMVELVRQLGEPTAAP